MEKTITVSGRPVRFKATGGIAYRYKAQFGREFLADVAVMEEFMDSKEDVKKKVKGEDGKIKFVTTTKYDFTKLSLETIYNILWTLAKTADEAVEEPQAWLDQFDTFPVLAIYEQVQDILIQDFKVDPKNA